MSTERETIINFNAAETDAQIYSCQSNIWRRCEKLGLIPKDIIKNIKGDIISKTYYCPKKWVKIRKPRKLSEDQKEKLRYRLQTIRQNQK